MSTDVDLKNLYYQNDNLLVLDSVLSDDALDELRYWALTTPPDPKYNYNGGYSSVDFAHSSEDHSVIHAREDLPVIKTIIAELKKNINVLSDKVFDRGWFFIYENECPGVIPHADPASINVNIWVTPDHCVLDYNKNGLIIYDKKYPVGWSWEDYNKDLKKIRRFLQDSDAKKRIVDYKCNRATIFDSSYFHETNGVSMKPGAHRRRIGFTFLFV